MSILKIRAAFESALSGMTPVIQTAYENTPFNPTTGTPYQRPSLLMAAPENPTFGSNFYRERGIFYVTLVYPLGNGTGAVMARAEAVKAFFKRGNSYSNGGVTVQIERTPEIASQQIDADSYSVPVKVRFWADIGG